MRDLPIPTHRHKHDGDDEGVRAMGRPPDGLPGALAAMLLPIADLGRWAALRHDALFRLAASAPPDALIELSPYAALRAARNARRRVPAYRELLARTGWRDNPRLSAAERVRTLPVTDKETYIKAFPTEERCLDGRIPFVGTQIDESAGSSGTPYNWVRGPRELREVHLKISQFARYTFGTHLLTINGFSMGSWATGVNVGEAMRALGIVKSTGPDVDKILHTLEFFGPHHTYLITGYPPFLKHLVDEGEARGFDWRAYRIFGVVGGEGMSEGLRAYLERRFQAVYSGYGASDLDIGVAGELPLAIWIRKRAAADPRLHRALFGEDGRLPMLFQYDPLDYYVETNDAQELIITINRLNVLSPRIRYNIHDSGGLIGFERMLKVLRDFGLDPTPELSDPRRPIFRLPFLYLYGRSDSTISYMGANIYPEDIEQALFAEPADAQRLGGYCMELLELGGGEQRPCIHVEVVRGSVHDPELRARLAQRILAQLLAGNRDFRASVSEDPSAGDLQLRLHAAGQGPFAASNRRIKRRYVVTASAAPPGG